MAEPPPSYEEASRYKNTVPISSLVHPPGGIPEPTAPLPDVAYAQPPRIPPPIHNNIHVVVNIPLGPHPTSLQCPRCHTHIITRAVTRAGLLTWLLCGGLALVGCWPCCLVPFCVTSAQDVEHFCPNCQSFLGKYSRI